MTPVDDRYLLDSGVAVRWYIEQPGFEECLRYQAAYLAGMIVLETVDVVRFELGNVLRKKGLLPKLITPKDYVMATRSLDDLGIPVHRTDVDVLGDAAELASRRMIGFFDAVLVVWAIERDVALLTTDARLCSAAAGLVRTELIS